MITAGHLRQLGGLYSTRSHAELQGILAGALKQAQKYAGGEVPMEKLNKMYEVAFPGHRAPDVLRMISRVGGSRSKRKTKRGGEFEYVNEIYLPRLPEISLEALAASPNAIPMIVAFVSIVVVVMATIHRMKNRAHPLDMAFDEFVKSIAKIKREPVKDFRERFIKSMPESMPKFCTELSGHIEAMETGAVSLAKEIFGEDINDNILTKIQEEVKKPESQLEYEEKEERLVQMKKWVKYLRLIRLLELIENIKKHLKLIEMLCTAASAKEKIDEKFEYCVSCVFDGDLTEYTLPVIIDYILPTFKSKYEALERNYNKQMPTESVDVMQSHVSKFKSEVYDDLIREAQAADAEARAADAEDSSDAGGAAQADDAGGAAQADDAGGAAQAAQADDAGGAAQAAQAADAEAQACEKYVKKVNDYLLTKKNFYKCYDKKNMEVAFLFACAAKGKEARIKWDKELDKKFPVDGKFVKLLRNEPDAKLCFAKLIQDKRVTGYTEGLWQVAMLAKKMDQGRFDRMIAYPDANVRNTYMEDLLNAGLNDKGKDYTISKAWGEFAADYSSEHRKIRRDTLDDALLAYQEMCQKRGKELLKNSYMLKDQKPSAERQVITDVDGADVGAVEFDDEATFASAEERPTGLPSEFRLDDDNSEAKAPNENDWVKTIGLTIDPGNSSVRDENDPYFSSNGLSSAQASSPLDRLSDYGSSRQHARRLRRPSESAELPKPKEQGRGCAIS